MCRHIVRHIFSATDQTAAAAASWWFISCLDVPLCSAPDYDSSQPSGRIGYWSSSPIFPLFYFGLGGIG